MTNTMASRYHCVRLFSAFIFSSSNWRQRHVASAQKTCVCFYGNSSLNTGPSRWSDDEGLSVQQTLPFTVERHHVTRLCQWQGNWFMLSLWAAATGPFLRTALNGTWKYGLQFPGTHRSSQFCLASRTFVCLKREGVERLSHSPRPKLWEAPVLACCYYICSCKCRPCL